MPHSSIADQHNLVVWVCLSQISQEYVHTVCIAVRENEEETVPIPRLHRAIRVSVFPYMVAWDSRSDSFPAPAAFRLVDPPESCLILEHQSNVLAWILGSDFGVQGFNFFEESCSSFVAAFGCLDLGITLRHPCRFITRYA